MLRRATFEDATVGDAHAQRPQVAPDGARDVVMLAVDVARDHAAEGDELRPRRDWYEESALQAQPIQRVERETGFGTQYARRVET